MGQLPSISKFKKGQKVIIGSRTNKRGFGLRGTIAEINPQDQFPIKVDVKLGTLYELPLSSYGKGWTLEE